ncbi:(deoxy)nucleoside triphosphate pyrophosphohydrolase [Butyrivibrio fibrisolvens]|uniref:(deoxy)nucleoside triphosphate pyrophosphohydrolase n=1 Tax=Butyrivibrio fibrisolvens TaxID=831 RepID=UPI0003B3D854|nr:(deoxy)nucleoside triphosphate pyrophosphohydrolase [Butyrivibrio fibrisolvens]
MKTVNVVAAIICDNYDNISRIFATQRGYGEFKDGWEFPGGKIEEGETPEEAIVREIKEELGATIKVHDLACVVDHDYDTFHLHMSCFYVTVDEGELSLLEHEAAKWLPLDELYSVSWLPADIKVVDEICKHIDHL